MLALGLLVAHAWPSVPIPSNELKSMVAPGGLRYAAPRLWSYTKPDEPSQSAAWDPL